MKGIVQKIFAKPFGDTTFYSFTLRNVDGFFNMGTTKPTFPEGASIEFESALDNKNRNAVQIATLQILKAEPEVVQAKTAGSGGWKGRNFASSKGAGAKDEFWTNKEVRDIETQRRIQLQSSRNSAIQFVTTLLAHGAVKLPEAPGKRYDIITALMEEWFEKFQTETNGTPAIMESSTEGEASTASDDNDSWEAA